MGAQRPERHSLSAQRGGVAAFGEKCRELHDLNAGLPEDAGTSRGPQRRRSALRENNSSHCPGFDVAGLVAATRVSLPLTNTFMEFSVSPDSSVYS